MKALSENIERMAAPLLADYGLELVDFETGGQGGRLLLRFFVDRVDRSSGGVSVDELGEFNLALSQLLDVEELVPESYVIEVSSPGLNRRLRKPSHFREHLGETVTVRTREPISGRKKFKGPLVAVDDEGVAVEVSGELMKIPHSAIAKANLEYRFDQ